MICDRATNTTKKTQNKMATLTEERAAQKDYWLQHSAEPTVEAMMLDSKAAEIDQLERPEVRWCAKN